MKTRIYFLDHLRTFLIFLVIVLHAGMSYERGFDMFWIVDDPAKNDSLAWVRTYIDLFVMFVMFFISGYFVPDSIKNKGNRRFLKSKFKRILLPWIIAVFTLIPAYKVIFLYSRGLPQEEWFSYFHLFQRGGTDVSFFANNPTQSWLWFLPILFTFQVVYLALARANVFPVKISVKTGVIMAIVISLAYSMGISMLGLKGWSHSAFFEFQRERLLVYFMVFLLGSLCNKQKIFESSTKNSTLLIGSVMILIPSLIVFKTVALNLFYNLIEPGRNHYLVSEFTDRLIYYGTALLAMFGFLYVLVFIFRSLFDGKNKVMNELNKNSYSVYIIHIIVAGIIALAMVNLSLPVFVKYFLLIVLTFAISNALVSGYRIVLQKNIYMRIATFVILVSAMFVFISAENGNEISVKEKTVSAEAPAMGLHEAVLREDVGVIRQHIAAGTDLNEKDTTGGGNPLHTAATFGKTKIVGILVEAGIDINYTNNEGSTPLHTAAFFGRTEIVKILLDAGADKTIRNNAGSTALESVLVPFEAVKGIYDYLGNAFAPLGLKLDYEQIKTARPAIAELLK